MGFLLVACSLHINAFAAAVSRIGTDASLIAAGVQRHRADVNSTEGLQVDHQQTHHLQGNAGCAAAVETGPTHPNPALRWSYLQFGRHLEKTCAHALIVDGQIGNSDLYAYVKRHQTQDRVAAGAAGVAVPIRLPLC